MRSIVTSATSVGVMLCKLQWGFLRTVRPAGPSLPSAIGGSNILGGGSQALQKHRCRTSHQSGFFRCMGTASDTSGRASAYEEHISGGDKGGVGTDAKSIPIMVRSISPSSVAAFKQCPRLFYYRWILGIKTPATRDTLKGIAVHEVLSMFYELDKRSRTVGELHELFRAVMTKIIEKEKKEPGYGYQTLFISREEEKAWVVECLDLLANFLVFERRTEGDGDPYQIEFKMRYDFDAHDIEERTVREQQKTTRGDLVADSPDLPICGSTFLDEPAAGMSVTGIVDRLDRCQGGHLRVVDYKTGKIPNLKYSEATNERIMDEKFFQLQIYALLVERVLGEVPREMRIVYLNGPSSVTRELDPRVLQSVERELRQVWDDIFNAVQTDHFPPRTSRLCDWCAFKDRCPAFGPG